MEVLACSYFLIMADDFIYRNNMEIVTDTMSIYVKKSNHLVGLHLAKESYE